MPHIAKVSKYLGLVISVNLFQYRYRCIFFQNLSNKFFFFFFHFPPSLHKICIISFLLQIPSFFNNATVYFCSHSVFVSIVFLRSVVTKFNQHSCHKWKTLGNRERKYLWLETWQMMDGWIHRASENSQWHYYSDYLTLIPFPILLPSTCPASSLLFQKNINKRFFASCILQVKEMTTSSQIKTWL